MQCVYVYTFRAKMWLLLLLFRTIAKFGKCFRNGKLNEA